MSHRLIAASVATLTGVSLLALPVHAGRPSLPPPIAAAQTDLDAFMAQVIERRDENWKKVQQYVLDEREVVAVRGPSNIPLFGQQRLYTWFIRDGFFVRSPLEADGVGIPESERVAYEERYLRRAKARDRRERERARREAAGEDRGDADPDDPDAVIVPIDEARVDQAAEVADEAASVDSLLVQTREPRFIDSAYFLEFTFEEGRYALVGRETVEDRDVLKIEYYPTQLFNDEGERNRGRRTDDDDMEATMERLMNKVSLVTLWVDPAEHQIVKYTFENVNFDFLPAAWLVRVNDVRATMTMSQPFPDVWLPRDVRMHFSAMLAIGDLNVDYRLAYEDYRQASTSGRIVGVNVGRGGGGGGGGGR